VLIYLPFVWQYDIVPAACGTEMTMMELDKDKPSGRKVLLLEIFLHHIHAQREGATHVSPEIK
jgi:hypothetical protein